MPISDAAIITPIQFGMIAALAYNYGLPSESAKASLGPAVARMAGMLTASSLAKVLPFLGEVFNAGVAGVLTGALGYITDQYLISCYDARLRGKPTPPFWFDWSVLKAAIAAWRKQSGK